MARFKSTAILVIFQARIEKSVGEISFTKPQTEAKQTCSSMFKTLMGQADSFRLDSPNYHLKASQKMCFLICFILMGEMTFVLMRF